MTNPESTDYTDPWGAVLQLFQDDEGHLPQPIWTESPASDFLGQSTTVPVAMVKRDVANSPVTDDFGAFSYKNVPVLKQANDDVIRKLKTESKPDVKSPLPSPSVLGLDASNFSRRKSLSQRIKKPPSVVTGTDKVRYSSSLSSLPY